MTKIDIFSGFLGAGKTTLLKKLIREAYGTEKLVLIENEFGEIGIDGAFLQEAGIQITEMNSGCICCSLVGDFSTALQQVIDTYAPDRILIEPSGVGKLSDVIRATETVLSDSVVLNVLAAVVDVNKCKMYMKNFGEFFNDQIAHANTVVFSRTQSATEQKIADALAAVRILNDKASVIVTPWDALEGAQILSTMEQKHDLSAELEALRATVAQAHHHHHEHDGKCHCHEEEHHHHHEHDGECHCHEEEHHHHHEHDGECHCHEEEHHHHHEHGEGCTCGCKEGHHHADDVFVSWGKETARKYSKEMIESILSAFSESDRYGMVLRAKGIVPTEDGQWLHFDYTPGEADVRFGSADVLGKLCVIGAGLDQDAIGVLFGV